MAEARATPMREKINRHMVFVVVAEGRRPFGEDGTIILKWKLEKLNGNSWNGFIWLKTSTSDGML
jgi:hypothetical protein